MQLPINFCHISGEQIAELEDRYYTFIFNAEGFSYTEETR
jgi:hypothetical protein